MDGLDAVEGQDEGEGRNKRPLSFFCLHWEWVYGGCKRDKNGMQPGGRRSPGGGRECIICWYFIRDFQSAATAEALCKGRSGVACGCWWSGRSIMLFGRITIHTELSLWTS